MTNFQDAIEKIQLEMREAAKAEDWARVQEIDIQCRQLVANLDYQEMEAADLSAVQDALKDLAQFYSDLSDSCGAELTQAGNELRQLARGSGAARTYSETQNQR